MLRLVSTIGRGKELKGIDQLTDNDVLHIYDVFEHHELLEIFKNKGRPKYVVADHWVDMDYPGVTIHCLPIYAAWIAHQTQPLVDVDYQTNYTFNFMVNKKQINRFACLKLIEFFKLSNYNYTHSGFNDKFDMHEIIQELDSLGDRAPLKDWDRSFILQPSTIPPKYFIIPGTEQKEKDSTLNYKGMAEIYLDHAKFIIKNSAVSLITESNWGQRGSVFTEKTVFTGLGLTMPIWIGGWQQPAGWKRMGFDIFDDVINHNYQNYETQIERFYYAFADNLELLTNHEKTAELREKLMPRLKRNQELLLQGQIAKYIDNEILGWPEDLQPMVPEILRNMNFKIPLKTNK